jgi:hypothetical protein
MTIKRTISRAFVTATIPVALIIGGASPALAGDDEKNHNHHWVCDKFNGHGDYDYWKDWKDKHCDDDNGNDHEANHDKNNDDHDRHDGHDKKNNDHDRHDGHDKK